MASREKKLLVFFIGTRGGGEKEKVYVLVAWKNFGAAAEPK